MRHAKEASNAVPSGVLGINTMLPAPLKTGDKIKSKMKGLGVCGRLDRVCWLHVEEQSGPFPRALWKRKWTRTSLKQPAEEGDTEIRNTRFLLGALEDLKIHSNSTGTVGHGPRCHA